MTSTPARYMTAAEHSRHAQIRELRRQRDRAALEAIWRQIAATPSCALCAHGRTGPRCAACVLRGILP